VGCWKDLQSLAAQRGRTHAARVLVEALGAGLWAGAKVLVDPRVCGDPLIWQEADRIRER
jgi:hypothetical protein